MKFTPMPSSSGVHRRVSIGLEVRCRVGSYGAAPGRSPLSREDLHHPRQVEEKSARELDLIDYRPVAIGIPRRSLDGHRVTVRSTQDSDRKASPATGSSRIAVSLTIAIGGSGGVFVPSLFMGAMLGSSFGEGLHALLPAISGSAGAYCLIGMGAVFAQHREHRSPPCSSSSS